MSPQKAGQPLAVCHEMFESNPTTEVRVESPPACVVMKEHVTGETADFAAMAAAHSKAMMQFQTAMTAQSQKNASDLRNQLTQSMAQRMPNDIEKSTGTKSHKSQPTTNGREDTQRHGEVDGN